ncbi:signal peptidase I [Streptomyces glaucescens]|uniref:Signal peptidase I n=1 Tax=Streptomyces glaucescens TaxID=1907 RepID=A0A089WZJ9_STRGA|nr:signal peptidase I [Streptomyces glaucescens]AIR96198.1 signal peptidase [Streptomyces glaucescens]
MSRTGRGPRVTAWVLAATGTVLAVSSILVIGSNYGSARVNSDAMTPTYSSGDLVFLEKIDAGEIQRGDVVFYRTANRYQGMPVLQRVIGLGGDRVRQGPGGPVTVNGEPLAEPYVKDGDPSGTTVAYDVVVPEGRLFLLGDHRANSNDSRYFLTERSGSVAATAVRARALDSRTGLLLWAAAGLLGLLAAVGGLAAGVVSWARRRAGRQVTG